jgi:CHAT domain-containing protein
MLGISQPLVSNNIAFIGAMWPASIDVSTHLARLFYNYLLVQRLPIGSALYAAKQEIIKKYGLKHPQCEWANFILYGDPSTSIQA